MSIDLIGPDGREYTLDNPDPAALDEVLRQGFKRPVAKYEPQTFGEKVAQAGADVTDVLGTTAAGALQGITGGLFGAALGKSRANEPTSLTQETAHELKRQQEAHPIANVVGEIGGSFASPINEVQGLVTGGIGATTALGRIGAQAVGGGAVGALYGAGNTLSDAALGDHELTADKLFAGAGLGVILGLGGGALGAGLEEGVSAALPRLSKAAAGLKEPLEDFADQRWLKAGGAIQSDIKKIPPEERAAVANVIREAMEPAQGALLPKSNLEGAAATIAGERDATAKQLLKQVGVGDAGGLTHEMDNEEALSALNKGFKENGDKMGAVLKQADQLGARPAFSPIFKKFDAFEEALNPAERDIVSTDIAKARKYLLEMGATPAGSPKNSFAALNDLKSTLQGDINYAADSGVKNSLKKQLAGIIKGELDAQLEPQIGADLMGEFLQAKTAYGALKSAAKAIKSKSKTGADAISALVDNAKLVEPSLAGKWSALDHAAKLVSHGIDRKLGNRVVSASDYLTGIGAGVMHGGPLGVLTGLASTVGHKILREHGSAVIARLADGIAKSPKLSVVAQSFGAKLPQAAPFLGKYAQPLIQAFEHEPARALATHMTWAQAIPEYADAAEKAGFLPETPEEHAHAMDKAGAMVGVAGHLQKNTAEIDRGIEQVLKGKRSPHSVTGVLSTQDFGAKRQRKDDEAAHQQRLSEIRALAADPSALVDRVASNVGRLGDMAPGVSAAMTNRAHAAVSFLANSAQEPLKAGPLAPDWKHSEAEMHSFAKTLETVQDPMSVLKHAAAGTLTGEQMRAFNAVYPSLAREVADKTLQRMADAPKAVPYRARLMLGLLTNTDPDGTIGLTASNQAAINAASIKPSNQGQPSPKADSLTVAQRTATPQQKRELGHSNAI